MNVDRSENPLILIVDDSPTIIYKIMNSLSGKGYELTSALNGIEALDIIKVAKPDLILLDVVMPELDGYDLCRKLKENPVTHDIPIIFLTNRNDEEAIIKGFETGGVDYIFKSCSIPELHARVSTHIDLKIKTDKLKKMALLDGLTGIYNHHHINERLSFEISKADRHNLSFSIILFDIDHFKMINDTYGHKTGDKVLSTVVSKINTQLREEDIFGRYGGDEFLIILPYTDNKSAILLGSRITNCLHKIICEDHEIDITISGGICSWDKSLNAHEMVKKADGLLYKAKEKGRNLLVIE